MCRPADRRRPRARAAFVRYLAFRSKKGGEQLNDLATVILRSTPCSGRALVPRPPAAAPAPPLQPRLPTAAAPPRPQPRPQAFGNAKTSRNNSSRARLPARRVRSRRAGRNRRRAPPACAASPALPLPRAEPGRTRNRLRQVCQDRDEREGQVLGATTKQYLLEKSRVPSRARASATTTSFTTVAGQATPPSASTRSPSRSGTLQSGTTTVPASRTRTRGRSSPRR